VTNVVVDTGGNFAADVSGTGSQFSADVVDRCCNLSGECFRKFREKNRNVATGIMRRPVVKDLWKNPAVRNLTTLSLSCISND